MTGDTVLEEVPVREMDDDRLGATAELALLAAVRAEAIEVVRQLHRAGGMSEAAAKLEDRPSWQLGQLEGVVLMLIAASDGAVAALLPDE
jgi:hypothetical protein